MVQGLGLALGAKTCPHRLQAFTKDRQWYGVSEGKKQNKTKIVIFFYHFFSEGLGCR